MWLQTNFSKGQLFFYTPKTTLPTGKLRSLVCLAFLFLPDTSDAASKFYRLIAVSRFRPPAFIHPYGKDPLWAAPEGWGSAQTRSIYDSELHTAQFCPEDFESSDTDMSEVGAFLEEGDLSTDLFSEDITTLDYQPIDSKNDELILRFGEGYTADMLQGWAIESRFKNQGIGSHFKMFLAGHVVFVANDPELAPSLPGLNFQFFSNAEGFLFLKDLRFPLKDPINLIEFYDHLKHPSNSYCHLFWEIAGNIKSLKKEGGYPSQ